MSARAANCRARAVRSELVRRRLTVVTSRRAAHACAPYGGRGQAARVPARRAAGVPVSLSGGPSTCEPALRGSISGGLGACVSSTTGDDNRRRPDARHDCGHADTTNPRTPAGPSCASVAQAPVSTEPTAARHPRRSPVPGPRGSGQATNSAVGPPQAAGTANSRSAMQPQSWKPTRRPARAGRIR